MSHAISESAGRRYGLEPVFRVPDLRRSTLDAQQARKSGRVIPLHPMQRGLKLVVPDAESLLTILADLDAASFIVEGQRKGRGRLSI